MLNHTFYLDCNIDTREVYVCPYTSEHLLAETYALCSDVTFSFIIFPLYTVVVV